MANLDNLRITDRELDKITGLDISDTTMGWAYRQTAFQPQNKGVFLSEQILNLCVAAIFCLPITLLLARAISGDSVEAVWRWLPIGVISAIALIFTWTFYRYQAGKHLLTLNHLLDDIDRFNEMVDAVEILEELNTAQKIKAAENNAQPKLETIQPNLENREEVLEALHLTRESLIFALTTEKVMRNHQQFMSRKQEMFSSIERNLATLQLLHKGNEANEYSRLLNEAIQIGTSVHQELRREEGK